MTARAAGRGGGWVLAQFVVMALSAVAALLPPHWPAGARLTLGLIGAVLFVVGVGIALAATRAMGRSFTPFPTPTSSGTLVVSGPFRIVRHPIYLGGLLVFGGIGLATSIPSLVCTFVLAAIWVGKLRVEERQLRATYVGYDAYAQAVRFRLIPGLY